MVRLRHVFAPPGGLGPWATGLALLSAGPALAAPSAVETLDAAVARELGGTGGTGVLRPVSGGSETPSGLSPYAPRPLRRTPGTSAASAPALRVGTKPKASTGQPEVKSPLDEMYQRNNRGPIPPLPPHTRRPNGQSPARPGQTKSSVQASGLQQVSSPPGTGASVPAGQPSGVSTKVETKKPSFLDRLTGRTGKKTTTAKRTSSPRKTSTSTASGGGLLGQMLKPFGGEEEQTPVAKEQPPVPPAMPPYAPPAQPAAGPSPPRLLDLPVTSPGVAPGIPAAPPAAFAGPTSPAESETAEAEDGSFADIRGETAVASEVSPTHPLADDFADIRGDVAPNDVAAEALDPDFVTPVEISEHGAPRPLDPEAFDRADEFAPVQVQNPPAELPVVQPQESPAARYAELQRKLAERSGLGGFQGFCPVVLRDRRELVDSRPEFLSVYKNRTYELSSAEAKARFDADPARYAPVNDGRDVVLTSRGQSETEGTLVHAVWFKDRLYLFHTADTMREFNAEPAKYAVSE